MNSSDFNNNKTPLLCGALRAPREPTRPRHSLASVTGEQRDPPARGSGAPNHHAQRNLPCKISQRAASSHRHAVSGLRKERAVVVYCPVNTVRGQRHSRASVRRWARLYGESEYDRTTCGSNRRGPATMG